MLMVWMIFLECRPEDDFYILNVLHADSTSLILAQTSTFKKNNVQNYDYPYNHNRDELVKA